VKEEITPQIGFAELALSKRKIKDDFKSHYVKNFKEQIINRKSVKI